MPLHKGKRARILGRDLTPLAGKADFEGGIAAESSRRLCKTAKAGAPALVRPPGPR
jgi:hypothetical protein